MALLEERWFTNPEVLGSNPTWVKVFGLCKGKAIHSKTGDLSSGAPKEAVGCGCVSHKRTLNVTGLTCDSLLV